MERCEESQQDWMEPVTEERELESGDYWEGMNGELDDGEDQTDRGLDGGGDAHLDSIQ